MSDLTTSDADAATTTLDALSTSHTADAVAFCPHARCQTLLVCGSYELRKEESPPRRVGQNGSHLKFTVAQDQRYTGAIAFGMGHLAGDLSAGAAVDVAFEPKINEWQGRRTAEMVVKDLRISRV